MTTTASPRSAPTGRGPAVEHALDPFTPDRPPAAWGLRVLATLLDSALVASVTFLATGAAPTLAALPGLGTPGGTGGAAWTAGTLLALGALQAYTGMTPGKRVAHVAVVDDRTGRPIGLPGTVLRWFAHVLDAILLIGYLRSAFRKDGRTFADSLLGTVAVRTTAPPPHPLVVRLRTFRDRHAPWLRWPRPVTGAVALVLCAASAAASLTASSGGGTQMSEDQTSCVGTGTYPATAVFGSARSFDLDARLGIAHVTERGWEVGVAWSALPDARGDTDGGPLTAHLSVRAADGRVAGTADGTGDQGGLWFTAPDTVASVTVTTPESVAGWTARAVLVDGRGTVLAECSAPVPAIDADPASLFD